MGRIKVEKPTDETLATLGVTGWGIWECDPSTFDWEYEDDETCYLLEGKVTVRVKGSDEVAEFGKGDFVQFPKGMQCVWEVSEKVRKHYKFG